MPVVMMMIPMIVVMVMVIMAQMGMSYHRAREHEGRKEIHEHADEGDSHERERQYGAWVLQPINRLPNEPDADGEEQDPVQECGEHLEAVEPEASHLGGRAQGERDRHEAHDEREKIRKQVCRIAEQGEAAGIIRADELADEAKKAKEYGELKRPFFTPNLRKIRFVVGRSAIVHYSRSLAAVGKQIQV
jgi:hypothetical protein